MSSSELFMGGYNRTLLHSGEQQNGVKYQDSGCFYPCKGMQDELIQCIHR